MTTEERLHITNGLAQWRQLSRRQYCGNLHVIIPQQVQCKPPLPQAALTLYAMRDKTVRIDLITKDKTNNKKNN